MVRCSRCWGSGICSPVVDQELKWEEAKATAKTDSRWKGRRPVQSRSLVLETIACLPSLLQLHPDQLGLSRREGKTRGSTSDSPSQTQGSPEGRGQRPLPDEAPPTHAGNNQKGWLALSWHTLTCPRPRRESRKTCSGEKSS
jgi:hypothetical protein